jgi:hypothetical protein
MGELREFVAEILDRQGAAVEEAGPDGLEVLAPEPVRQTLGWPELARLGFGPQQDGSTIRIGLEGDWLDRFGALLGDHGRWAERQLVSAASAGTLADPERILEHTLELPNAIWRFQRVTATYTRCLLLAFRYAALSDEKREGLIWLGFNLGTGAAIDEIVSRLRPMLADTEWQTPEPAARQAAGEAWDATVIESRVRPLLEHRVRQDLETFVRAMRRRLERDTGRIYGYHDDLHAAALKRLTALAGTATEKAEADRRRETLRVATIEREYRAKLDDLRRNYALRVTVEWVQALDLYLPVQRFDVLIRRRKGERLVRLDWHPLARLAEPPPCDWGLGIERARLVCDDGLHLTEPAGQAPCSACGKAWCRACHPAACPRCGRADANQSSGATHATTAAASN